MKSAPTCSPREGDQSDELWDSGDDSGDPGSETNPLISDGGQETTRQATRDVIKQDKKDKKKRRNKKVRKRIRRVIRTSWKWFKRGFSGIAPLVVGFGVAPVIRPQGYPTQFSYSANRP